jgi:hypothetical protein
MGKVKLHCCRYDLLLCDSPALQHISDISGRHGKACMVWGNKRISDIAKFIWTDARYMGEETP